MYVVIFPIELNITVECKLLYNTINPLRVLYHFVSPACLAQYLFHPDVNSKQWYLLHTEDNFNCYRHSDLYPLSPPCEVGYPYCSHFTVRETKATGVGGTCQCSLAGNGRVGI